jgi:hypothetical protein
MNEPLVVILVLAVVLAMGMFLLFRPTLEPVEFKEWDTSVLVKLDPVKILTRAKGLSVPFKSHVDSWAAMNLLKAEINTVDTSLKEVFVSHTDGILKTPSLTLPPLTTIALGRSHLFYAHVDSLSVTNLTLPSINTIVVQTRDLFVSHVDAFLVIHLTIPAK